MITDDPIDIPLRQLEEAKQTLLAIGVVGCSISDGIRLLAELHDRAEKENVRLLSELHAVQHRLEKAEQALQSYV